MSQTLYDATYNARAELYASIGDVEPDVIAHLINPAFMGGPAWPSLRQAFSIIHRDEKTLIISNGLADPFCDVTEQNSGFGIEIYAETNEKIKGNVSNSTLFQLVYATAQQVAHSGKIADFVDQHGVITMELFADDCGLHEYQNDYGMVGIMIGIEHPELPKKVNFPGGKVILASVQILTPSELEYVAKTRAEGRNNLHAKFKMSGVHHILTPSRDSLIEAGDLQPNSVYQENKLALQKIKDEKTWWKFW